MVEATDLYISEAAIVMLELFTLAAATFWNKLPPVQSSVCQR